MESNRGPDLRVLVVLGSFINKRSPGDGGHRGFGFHWGEPVMGRETHH